RRIQRVNRRHGSVDVISRRSSRLGISSQARSAGGVFRDADVSSRGCRSGVWVEILETVRARAKWAETESLLRVAYQRFGAGDAGGGWRHISVRVGSHG